MKKLVISILGLALAAPMFAQNAAPTPVPPVRRHRATIEQRQRNQQRRIEQGERSGQLAEKEAARLEKREAGIERREQKMRASGGKFTRGERRAIQHQLDSTSKAIYREKHDKQHR